MKFILTPNLKPPYNLRRICPAWKDKKFVGLTETEIIDRVVSRGKYIGQIPCETTEERDSVAALRVEQSPDVVFADLPPVGNHWIVDEADLPGGSVSEANDHDYFFDAWEWED